MVAHDIDGILAHGFGPGPDKTHAAIAAPVNETDESELAGKKGKKKAAVSSRKARHAKQDDGAEAGKADGSHPRPDHETISWLLWNEFAVSPEVAAAALNVSRNTGYAAIHNGDIPATRVGNRLMVPTAYLRQRLYLEPPLPGEEPAPQTALQLKKQKQEVVKSPKRRR